MNGNPVGGINKEVGQPNSNCEHGISTDIGLHRLLADHTITNCYLALVYVIRYEEIHRAFRGNRTTLTLTRII